MPNLQINPALVQPVGSSFDSVSSSDSSGTVSFEQALEEAQSSGELHFSKHAAARMADRHLTLDGTDVQKLDSAVEQAADRGLQDSLVVLGHMAFIVDVPGKTVVTAMPLGEAQSNVFTNIDGAVIV